MLDLSIKAVSKVYGDVTAVHHVDLDLAGGKMVSFLGPSGCGKTTLLRMISKGRHGTRRGTYAYRFNR